MPSGIICSAVFALLVAAMVLKVMIATDYCYFDDDNRIKCDKLEILENSHEGHKKCERIMYEKEDVPLDTEDVIYYKDDIIILAAGNLKGLFEQGTHFSERKGNIYIFDVKQKVILPIEYENFTPGKKGFVPHGMYYSDDTKRLYIINHNGKGYLTTVDVFSVVPQSTSDYPKLKRLGAIKAGFGFGMLNDIVEASATEIYVTQWRSNPLPKRGMKGDTSFVEKMRELYGHLGLLSSYFYDTGFLYCRFNVTNLDQDQQCVRGNKEPRFGMANGITINKEVSKKHNLLYVNDIAEHVLHVYEIPKKIGTPSFHQKNAIRNQIKHVDTIKLIEAVDNVEYDKTRNVITAGGIPAKYKHLLHGMNPSTKVPGSMVVLDLKTKKSERVMYHNGDLLSATSSCIYTSRQNDDKIVCGSPYVDGVLLCEL